MARLEKDPAARERALKHAQTLRRTVASPQFAQLREATLHFAENPDSDQTFEMDAYTSGSEGRDD